MRIHHGLLLLSAIGFIGIGASSATAQNPPPEKLGKLVHDYADREVERLEIRLQGSTEPLERVPRSLLRWSNSARSPAFGDSYVWTEKGCARAFVSIYAIGAPRNFVTAECQSLTEKPLSMSRGEQVVWSTSEPGVEFNPVKDVPVPGETKTLRSVQMNAIARKFRADFASHNTPDEFTKLRLLPKPLYRYDSRNPKIVDGAVYGFVDATDPELLLVIEARKTDDKMSYWFAPARSRHDQMRLYFGSRVVWEGKRLAPPWDQIRDPKKTYFNLRFDMIATPAEKQEIEAMFLTD